MSPRSSHRRLLAAAALATLAALPSAASAAGDTEGASSGRQPLPLLQTPGVEIVGAPASRLKAAEETWLDGAARTSVGLVLDPFSGLLKTALLTTDSVGYRGNTDTTLPRVGDVFYTRVTSGNVFTRSLVAGLELRLPDGARTAITPETPTMCFLGSATSDAAPQPYTEICPADPKPGVLSWDAKYPFPFGGLFVGGATLKAGEYLQALVPVVATRPLKGIAGPPSEWLHAGVSATPGSTYENFVDQGVFVADRDPEVSYPADALGTGEGGVPRTTGLVASFWKAGTAFVDLGETIAYGRTSDAIPLGGDAAEAAFRVFADWRGLAPGTTYHWRVRFESGGRTFAGPDQTFTTPGGKGGAGTPTAPGGVADRVAPTARIAAAPGRLAAWRVLRGTVSDAGASAGVRSVQVAASRKLGRHCQAFTGARWVRRGCTKPLWVKARLDGKGRWTLRLKGLVRGPYTFRVRATDAAGNVQARPAVRSLRLR
jgi:hypothetical protein